MKRLLILAALGIAVAAGAAGVSRGLVEDGTNTTVADGTTDGGVTLVRGNGTTRLRPAACSAGTCTREAPLDAGANEGVSMEEITACRFMVCAPGGGTLTGTGKSEAWTRDPAHGRYGHMPAKDLNVTVSAEPCQAYPVETNDMAAAGVRLLYRPNAVGVLAADGGVASGSLITSLQCCKPSSGRLPYLDMGCGP